VFDETWRQVVAAWQNYVPFREAPQPVSMQARPEVPGEPVIEKARPGQAAEIASFLTQSSRGLKQIGREDIMAAFGEKAFVLVRSSNRLVGLVGWQVENLVARIDDIYLEESLPLETIMQPLLEEVERASRDLQCEASLLFLPGKLVQHREVWHNLGYEPRSIRNLGVRAWQEAALESMSSGEVLFFKQLREDRVLRPI
jgi:dephospho-CoA kinase